MKKEYFNFFYNSVYQILLLLIPLITTPYLTRVIGASGLGEYSYYYSIAYYFVIFSKLGLDNYGNRQIAMVRDNKEVLSKDFFSIYIFQLLLSVFCILLYVGFSLLNNEIIMTWLMIPYVLSSCADINWFFYGLEDFKIIVSRNIIIKVFTTVSIFIFVKKPEDIYLYVVLMTTSMLISQLSVWPFIKKRIYRVRVSSKDIKKHIIPNLVLFIPVIAVSLYKMMDKIMLGSLTSKEQVGFYDSSEKIIQIPMALIVSLGTVMLPRMSSLVAKNKQEEASQILGKSINLAMFLATSLSFGIMGISRTFVPWFYGDGFEVCIPLYKILLPSCVFLAFANVLRTQYLIPQKREKEYCISVIIGAAINFTVNVCLIPSLGPVGAAIGTLIAEFSVFIIQCFCVRKEIPIAHLIFTSLKYIISGILMFIILDCLYFSDFSPLLEIIIKVLIGIGIYSIILLLLTLVSNVIYRKKGKKPNKII